MVASLKKRPEDRVSLRGLLESNVLQMTVKDVLSFAYHLAGDGGLIIDALLQHGKANWRSGYHPGILKMKFNFTTTTTLTLLFKWNTIRSPL
jgi:hypothetical protein